MTSPLPHTPVLLDRVVDLLADTPDGVFVDLTLGAAGHAHAVLERRVELYGRARLVGLDRDPDALGLAAERLADLEADVEMHLVHARFDRLDEVLDDLGIASVSAVLMDLGISSMHVDRPERGFSYRQEGPLDMRMDPTQSTTAEEIVNTYDRGDLSRLLRRHGDEKFADRIARAIVDARPLTSTTALAEVVKQAIPAAARRTGGHPATRTFQALRIAVNDELEALAAVLPLAIERLGPGGICLALSYHSLEDRLVKRAFADAASGCICPRGLPVCACGRVPLVEPVVRRPERPDPAETEDNPRAAAARLRAARRLPEPRP